MSLARSVLPVSRRFSLELASELDAVHEVARRLPRVVPDAPPPPIAAEIVVAPRGEAAHVRYDFGDVVRPCVWSANGRGELRFDRTLGSVECPVDPSQRVRFEVGVDPDAVQECTLRMIRVATELALALRGSLMLHASAVVVDGVAHLFLGASGAGKTTTARRLGRGGALRVSDDTVMMHDVASAPRVEPFFLDRGGWLAGRPGASWPLGRALFVRKAAARTRLAGTVANPLRAWCSAAFAPALPVAHAATLIEGIARLAAIAPPRDFEVAPSGDVLAAILSAPHESTPDGERAHVPA